MSDTFTKRIGFGVTLSVNGSVIGTIVDNIEHDSSRDVGETTVLGDAIKTYMAGQIDPGKVTFTIAYESDQSGTTKTLNDLYYSGATATWLITYPAVGSDLAETETFTGFISARGRSINKNELITSKVEIQLTGDPGFPQ